MRTDSNTDDGDSPCFFTPPHSRRATFRCMAPNTRVRVSPVALRHCISIGAERNERNRINGSRSLKYSGLDDLLISVQGVIGEWVFNEGFGLDTAHLFDTRCRNARTDTFDATMPNGWTVDVKTVRDNTQDLQVPEAKAVNPPHLYALVCVERANPSRPFSADEPVSAVFKGFVRASELFRPRHMWHDSHTGWCYFIYPRDRLGDWASVIAEPYDRASFF